MYGAAILFPGHPYIESTTTLSNKVESMLVKIDKSFLSHQQKLNLYKIGVCPKITWDLTINNSLPKSWLDNQL